MSNLDVSGPHGSLDFDSPANVLLLSPSMSNRARNVCPTANAPDASNLLLVSLDGNPDARLEAWRRNCELPETIGVVTWDESRGAVGVQEPSTTMRLPTPEETTVSVTTVTGPDDLTGIGIKVSQCLSAWANAKTRTTMFFDSVTTLLQYVDRTRALRFLDTLTTRIEQVDGVAYYHIDPSAHDEETLESLRGLFSHVLEFDGDTGEWQPA